jgi:hypothetical protein
LAIWTNEDLPWSLSTDSIDLSSESTSGMILPLISHFLWHWFMITVKKMKNITFFGNYSHILLLVGFKSVDVF